MKFDPPALLTSTSAIGLPPCVLVTFPVIVPVGEIVKSRLTFGVVLGATTVIVADVRLKAPWDSAETVYVSVPRLEVI